MTAYGTGRTMNDQADIPTGVSPRSVLLGAGALALGADALTPTAEVATFVEGARMAVCCREAGLQLLLAFHVGDTWNSVGAQNLPATWRNMNYSRMRDARGNGGRWDIIGLSSYAQGSNVAPVPST